MNEMCWADLYPLVSPVFFNITRTHVNVEDEIVRLGGERLTDALHPPRRFEYPWTYVNLPNTRDIVILDAGGGPASFQYLLALNFKRVVNVDMNREFLARVEAIKHRTTMFPNLETQLGLLSKLDYPDKYFDVTTCVSVLEHSDEDVFPVIDELLRVTKDVVLITIDVKVGGDVGLGFDILNEMGKRYGFEVPEIHNGALRLIPKNGTEDMCIACIRLEVENE